jgi:hypothetical protein
MIDEDIECPPENPPGNCDCCTLCVAASCGLPEYTCPGYCGMRGKPGHFKDNAPNRDHPQVDFPERGARWT